MSGIPKGITRTDVLQAIKQLDAGAAHPFGPSRKFDLVHGGRRYPPKAVIGLAARRLAGRALTPQDFSGGEESRCHRVLKGLRFSIVERAVGRARVDRSSPLAAEAVIETLLADAPKRGRQAALQFLADSMAYVDGTQPDRWGVTLEPGHVRFNAGQTESVVLWSGEVQVLVADASRIAGTTVGDHYPSAGGARLRAIPFEMMAKVLPGLRATHEAAMLTAMRRPSTRVIKNAHSPGVVEYLWATLGIDGAPPVPTYFVANNQTERATRKRRQALSDEAIMALPDLALTEKTAVIKQRLAQSLFRRRLSATQGSCRVTGVNDRLHLRASHVKPWRDCSPAERQDPNNGLLLAPHVDHLFDQGYLSFEDDGTVLVSPHLDRTVLDAWGLDPTRKGTPFSVEQAKYLAHHRKHVFEKRKV